MLNTVCTLRFFFSNCSLFHISNKFGSCIINILYRGCAKIKKIIPAPKGKVGKGDCLVKQSPEHVAKLGKM